MFFFQHHTKFSMVFSFCWRKHRPQNFFMAKHRCLLKQRSKNWQIWAFFVYLPSYLFLWLTFKAKALDLLHWWNFKSSGVKCQSAPIFGRFFSRNIKTSFWKLVYIFGHFWKIRREQHKSSGQWVLWQIRQCTQKQCFQPFIFHFVVKYLWKRGN